MRQPRILPHEKCAFPGTSTGKRARRTPVASGSLSSISSFNSGSLSICDSGSGTTFLVDSGADVSVLPATAQDRRCLPSGRSLVAANGTSICTYGSRTLPLTFPGLKTSHSFLLADVPRPILGSDFFSRVGLLIDLKVRRLVRPPLASSSTAVVAAHHLPASPQLFGLPAPRLTPYDELLDAFPAVLVPNFDISGKPAHGVEHSVPTVGPPVFARPRRLIGEKLAVNSKR